MAFFFKNTKKDIIMTDENEKDFKNIDICRLCEIEIISDKVRDHCHLSGKYSGLAHSYCNINVTQDQSTFIPFIFHNSSNYDCHLFLTFNGIHRSYENCDSYVFQKNEVVMDKPIYSGLAVLEVSKLHKYET